MRAFAPRPRRADRDRWKLLHSRGLDPHRVVLTTSSGVALDARGAPAEADCDKHPPCAALPLCTEGELAYCKARLARPAAAAVRASSEFSLMLRGDDETSDRLENAVAALAIPVVVEDVPLAWLPLRHKVKWDELLVKVPRAAFDANASAAVAAALDAVPPWRRRRMREKMEALRPHLLWTVPRSDKAPLMLQAALQETAQCGVGAGDAPVEPPCRLGTCRPMGRDARLDGEKS